MKNWTTLYSAVAAALLFVGCAFAPIKPGIGVLKSTSGFVAAVQQSENPKTDSTQNYERTTEDAQGVKTVEKVQTRIGAAQKDTARETAAKLASLRPTLYVGILVFLLGVASLFWPPLKVIVGSVTTSLVMSAAGLALIVLPALIVGNEVLFLCAGVGAAALYFFAHRHGTIHSRLNVWEK